MSAAEAPRARIHLTGAGGWGIATCLAIGAAAANTSNNLLYLMLALLLAAYAMSSWASRRSLQRLRMDVVSPREVFPGDDADVIATFCTARGAAPGVVVELQALQPGEARPGAPPQALSVPVVPEGASVTVALTARFVRRGAARIRLLARSPFPFGLIEGVRRMAEEEVLVLPSPDASWRRAVPESGAEGEPLPRKGEGTDIFNIRDYAWGEDARRMEWKATARLGRPMVREHASEKQRSATILLPWIAASDAQASERAISRAAGAAQELEAGGWKLRLLAPGADVRGDDRAILRALARLSLGPAPADGWWRPLVEPGESLVRIEPGSPAA